MSVIDKKEITVSEAKRLLEEQSELLGPLQRRVLDYAIRFSRLSADDSSKLVEELTKEELLDESLAVHIANAMPSSVEEITTFLGRQRIISEETIQTILGKIEKYKSSN
jgi:DNA-directed RNA polymerase subunit F